MTNKDMEPIKCFYCGCDNPTFVISVPIYIETYFKGFYPKFVCKNCNESEKK